MKRKIALFITILMFLSLLPVTALAASHNVVDGESLNLTTGVLTRADSSTTTYPIAGGDTINVAAGATATITGSKNVIISCGEGVDLTLDGITIDVSGTSDACALAFSGGSAEAEHNTLTLVGDSTLKSGSSLPGIRAQGTTVLTITGSGKVTIQGGENAAGIGGGDSGNGGSITISGSAVVDATGGSGLESGAGIGGGRFGSGGTITISGSADVTATGRDGGAGIGGGYHGNGGSVTILDSANVTAQGSNGAGIGGGWNGDGGSITISGSADVTTTGNGYGAGIGGGNAGDGGSITISGSADVTATGGDGGAGVGGGNTGDGGSITITGGKVTAWSGLCAAGIGGGNAGDGGSSITISGSAVVDATGKSGGAGIGGGVDGDGGTIHITGGTLTITGSEGGAGIGGGYNEAGGTVPTGGNITIDGGIVTATSGPKAAGIGGGYEGDGGSITISGTADVNTTGGYGAAGIGGGYNDYGNTVATGGTIHIDGGIVTATGGGYGAGIGGGVRGDGGSITISGSADITAISSAYGAGIGGGPDGAGGMIHIDGGTVTAIGGENSTGIGGGYRDHGGNITISGGIVYAVKGADGKHDIGDGVGGCGGTLQISGDAGVFLANDECISPATTHTHFDITEIDNGKLYGIETPAECTRAGGYFMPITLSYDPNGGAGTVPGNVIQHLNTMVTVAAKGDLTNERLAMVQWNTDAGGKGYGYFPGVDITLTEDVTLYAIWRDRDVTSVTLDKHTLSLTHHDTDSLMAAVDPNESTKNDVVWYSTNTGVADVDQSGNVTAVDVGSATIVAWSDGVRDTCAVTVSRKTVTGVMLSAASKTLTKGEMANLSAVITPSNATNADITWTSGDTSVVTVDDRGVVSAVGAGEATITASADGKSATCIVTVQQGVTGVSLSSTSKTLTVGHTASLKATATPSNATNAGVTWTSTDTSVATVNGSGKVTAVSEGAAVVIAAAGGAFDTCAVMVQRPNLSVTLSSTVKTMTIGDTIVLSAAVVPADEENAVVTWKSTDKSIATVDGGGKVTAVSEGAVSIIVKADSAYDVFTVLVNAPTNNIDDNDTDDYGDIEGDSDTESYGNEADVKEDTPDMGNHSQNVTPKEVVETQDNPKVVIVYIDVSDLPEGTESVRLADGSVVEIGDGGTLQLEIDKGYLGKDGSMEVIALSGEGTPLADFYVNVSQFVAASSSWDTAGPILMWVLIGIAGAAVVAVTLYFVIRKKKA